MIAVGLLRFGLDLPELKVQALLADGWGVRLVLSDISRLSVEFLVRWRMFCEEALPRHREELGPLVVQVDGTVVGGGPTTGRARHALTGAMLWAEQMEAENDKEADRFLTALRARFENPALLLRDGSPTWKGAMARIFPEVPQGEDHWHFLDDRGPEVMPDYPRLTEALVKDHGLANLAKESRRLPLEGRTVEEVERVWVRAVLEWVEAAREHPGGFPFRLAYLEVAHRLEAARRWAEEVIRGNLRRGLCVADVAKLKMLVGRLLDREGVKLHLGRTESEAVLWGEIRRAMRAEREHRSHPELAPMTREDVARAKEEITVALDRFAQRGDWAQAIVATVVKRFEAHGPYLWTEVPGLSIVVRSTVPLERDHGADRRRIRHRTGRAETGAEMGRLGSLLAFWSNVRCPWFRDHVLSGVNLWEVFVGQDAGEVRRRILAMPREGRRPRVVLPRGEKGRERLEELVRLIAGEGPLEPALSAWATSVAPTPDQEGGVSDGYWKSERDRSPRHQTDE
jgi:hypothetical protein